MSGKARDACIWWKPRKADLLDDLGEMFHYHEVLDGGDCRRRRANKETIVSQAQHGKVVEGVTSGYDVAVLLQQAGDVLFLATTVGPRTAGYPVFRISSQRMAKRLRRTQRIEQALCELVKAIRNDVYLITAVLFELAKEIRGFRVWLDIRKDGLHVTKAQAMFSQMVDTPAHQRRIVRLLPRCDGQGLNAGGLCDPWPQFRDQHAF